MLNALNLLRRPCCSRLTMRTHAGLLHTQALDDWIASPKQMVLRDTFTLERLTDLYSTLPTRDGSRAPYQPPGMATPLPYGTHLAFFHPRTPESLLCPDGTDADFCPPEPFTRRMWAGGRMFWDNDNPLLSHKGASASSTIASVEKKGFDKGNPMIFVNQRIEVTMASNNDYLREVTTWIDDLQSASQI
ncbi:hypothetical protein C8J57DRAFT_1299481 [Mycena rebaudengoi]|nr:hypothetical protein C8J57DRAFT_1299481 [Mycena rebaudengoi]